jgi:hypothetical protein
VQLREALAAEPQKFVQTVTQNLLTYALGRTVEYHDMPDVRSIVRQAEDAHYSFESIVMGVATSIPFRRRTLPDTVGDDTVTAATE